MPVLAYSVPDEAVPGPTVLVTAYNTLTWAGRLQQNETVWYMPPQAAWVAWQYKWPELWVRGGSSVLWDIRPKPSLLSGWEPMK